MTQAATVKIPGNTNFCGGEIQNAKLQSLISKDNPTEAEFWYDSVNHEPVYNDGTSTKPFGRIYSNFVGADGTNAGSSGLVPAPSATDNTKFLCGDGTYKKPTFSAGDGIDSTALGNGTIKTSTTVASKTDIGDGKTIFKKNGTAFATISANQTSTINVNYTIPTAVTDLSDASDYAKKSDLVTAYTPAGNVNSASDLPTLSADVLGYVYHVTSSFNTTSDFVEGSGKTIQVGNDITVVDVGTGSSHSYKFNVYGDFIDVSGKQDTLTAGNNITINGNTISATNTTYTFSTGLTYSSGTVSVTDYNRLVKKFTETLPAKTTSDGVCSWTIANPLGTEAIDVSVYDVGTTANTKIYPAVTVNSSNIIISLLSSSNISAGDNIAVITG